jgi:Rrf2 family protein
MPHHSYHKKELPQMITREADYAIRVMLYLAGCGNDTLPVSTDVLAKEMHIPYRFLRRIVSKMVKAGLVLTTRGRGGGLLPARGAADVSLLDVLTAIDPRSLRLNACLDDTAICPRSATCAVRREVSDVQTQLTKRLKGISFSTLSAAKAG